MVSPLSTDELRKVTIFINVRGVLLRRRRNCRRASFRKRNGPLPGKREPGNAKSQYECFRTPNNTVIMNLCAVSGKKWGTQKSHSFHQRPLRGSPCLMSRPDTGGVPKNKDSPPQGPNQKSHDFHQRPPRGSSDWIRDDRWPPVCGISDNDNA